MSDFLADKLGRLEGGRPTVLDLFSGCGGISLGFQRAGCEILGGVEQAELASRTHAANFHPESEDDEESLHGTSLDIRAIDPLELIRDFGHDRPRAAVDLIVGGPPCQAYARVGRAKLREVQEHPEAFKVDERGSLFEHSQKNSCASPGFVMVMGIDETSPVLTWPKARTDWSRSPGTQPFSSGQPMENAGSSATISFSGHEVSRGKATRRGSSFFTSHTVGMTTETGNRESRGRGARPLPIRRDPSPPIGTSEGPDTGCPVSEHLSALIWDARVPYRDGSSLCGEQPPLPAFQPCVAFRQTSADDGTSHRLEALSGTRFAKKM